MKIECSEVPKPFYPSLLWLAEWKHQPLWSILPIYQNDSECLLYKLKKFWAGWRLWFRISGVWKEHDGGIIPSSIIAQNWNIRSEIEIAETRLLSNFIALTSLVNERRLEKTLLLQQIHRINIRQLDNSAFTANDATSSIHVDALIIASSNFTYKKTNFSFDTTRKFASS